MNARNESGRTGRTVPHSYEAECAVLGAVLLDNTVFEQVGALLSAADFYVAANGAVWQTASALIVAGKPADVLTVFDAGGHDLAGLNALTEGVPAVRHALRYAEIVRDRSARRSAAALAAELYEQMMAPVDEAPELAAAVDAACMGLLALQAGADGGGEPRPVVELVPDWLARLQDRFDGKTDAISTGFRDIDDVLGGGLWPGELVVIASRPSMGKSAFVGALTRNVAKDHVVLGLSLEDSAPMLMSRFVAALGRINLADLRRPDRAPASMWERVSGSISDLSALKLYIDDSASVKVQDVRRKAQQVRRRAGSLSLIVVDYVQLMDADSEGEVRAQQITAVARAMKRLAKEMGCPVVLLSQLNRKADEVQGPPRLEHLAESDGMEQAADVIGLLWREARRKPTAENKFKAQIEWAKNKSGATDTTQLFFDGATQRFESSASTEGAHHA